MDRRARGKDAIYQGDVCAYAPFLHNHRFQVVVMNPPCGLWWPTGGAGSPLADYELASRENVESQCMTLELAARVLQANDGLLLAVMSGRSWDTTPRAAQFLREHFQVVAVLRLPQPFAKEYGIAVDASLVVAGTVGCYVKKAPAPLTGTFEDDDPAALVAGVTAAFQRLRPDGDWPRAWTAFYAALPLRELAPMEYLAWFNDGPITAEHAARIPKAGPHGQDVEVPAGATYHLRVRRERLAEQAGSGEVKGRGKKTCVLREFIDRGFLLALSGWMPPG